MSKALADGQIRAQEQSICEADARVLERASRLRSQVVHTARTWVAVGGTLVVAGWLVQRLRHRHAASETRTQASPGAAPATTATPRPPHAGNWRPVLGMLTRLLLPWLVSRATGPAASIPSRKPHG